jgi:hypothetical protein
LSRVISPLERGLYMGMQQTYGGVARIIAPLFFGLVVRPARRLVALLLLVGLHRRDNLSRLRARQIRASRRTETADPAEESEIAPVESS